ncbi:MAG TPA: HAMP domain-containing sensor histidine kinase [Solirubrobacterales bacterium]|nr:HAMP domain-containing sensor histidine kinase [Solirubrobacterales bacterium]
MAAIGLLRRRGIEIAWVVFAAANLVAMALIPSWETIPFHFIWISLTLLYGFRVWGPRATGIVLGLVIAATGSLILSDAFEGSQLWGELFEVPLMSAMFLAMVWHARRRQDALRILEREGAERAALLAQQKRFLHDVSHELRTPVTIARGHLEVLRRVNGEPAQEIEVALDELGRIENILERLLLLAKSKQPDFVVPSELELEPFLEDVFVRWSGVVQRGWRLGELAPGRLRADPDALRIALDALLENAVKYTEPADAITLSAHAVNRSVLIEVADEGQGLLDGAGERIFERFARADPARTRAQGGAGLGLAIVDAIVRAHGGACSARNSAAGAVFTLRFPAYVPPEARASAFQAGPAVPS